MKSKGNLFELFFDDFFELFDSDLNDLDDDLNDDLNELTSNNDDLGDDLNDLNDSDDVSNFLGILDALIVLIVLNVVVVFNSDVVDCRATRTTIVPRKIGFSLLIHVAFSASWLGKSAACIALDSTASCA